MLGRVHINGHNPRVRVRAADKGESERIGQVEIVYILRFAQQDTRVFDPAYLRADHFAGSTLGGCHMPVS